MTYIRFSTHPSRDWLFSVAGVERISDGDSYWLFIDTGFRRASLENFRLMGYDTAEIFSSQASAYEKEKGHEAKQAAIDWFDAKQMNGDTIWVRSYKDDDAYGRWLGDFWTGTPTMVEDDLGEHLEYLGLAVRSPDGKVKWRDVYDPEG